jgi:cobalt-zinc-cadmium efflux system membrane fusion protein
VATALGWKPAASGEPSEQNPSAANPPEPAAEEFPTQVKLASRETAKEMGIELAPVESRSLTRTITCNGRAAFNQNHYAQIRSRVEGIVCHISAGLGKKVQAGDVLVVVDSPHLGDVKSAYIIAEAQVTHLEWDYLRLKELVDRQSVPIKAFHEADILFKSQQTTTANARQQLINLGFTADQLKRLVEAKDTSTELPVTAPWDGVVVARHAVDGELVESNAPLFAIADLRTMWVYLNLYESDMNLVQVGQSVSFEADGLPDTRFEGQIQWISPEVDPRTRITEVLVEVDNKAGALRANMFGKGRIVVHSSHDSLVVPELAVQTYRERPVVFVRETDDSFAVRPVTIGIKGEQYWELLSGAKSGEQVTTTGSFLLKSELEKDKLGEAE